MKTNNNYENEKLGFDRTQLFKEHVQPQITRSSALNATIDWCKINKYPLSLLEVISLSKHFVSYIEEGKTDWMSITEEKIKKRLSERTQEIDSVLID
jgi:hypothetical protein